MASLLLAPPFDFAIRSVVFLVIIWIGLFCTVEISAGGDVGEVLGKGGHTQREFDYFKLALQWPGTVCHRTRHCCSSNGCCRGADSEEGKLADLVFNNFVDIKLVKLAELISNKHVNKDMNCLEQNSHSNAPTGFTIRMKIDGLWADYNDGTWPACCTGKKFDVREISTLLDALNKYWPSLSCSSPSNCHGGKGLFWEHEEVLREAGYVASNSEKYPLGGIVSAIQNAFHTTPELECKGDAIEELRLCFDKNLKPRDCAVDSNTESGFVTSKKSCPRYVSLPDYASLNVGKNDAEVSQSTLHSSI
ncbi:Ribonuclease 2 [Sesamum angolense]|uniref:Ribonuclease 2 n=1 Tax=Sesamum angolense TaxID=2727404 RepID=A0AAE2C4G0_9LAMI|nr:Ribonuclease 2 [Sesamum angolense]